MKEDINKGWISLHRKIQDHWLWPKGVPFTKFEAFVDLLLNANHSEQKVNIKNEILICKRGQSIRSMETLSLAWNWHKSRVRRFLILLQSDHMIELEPLSKSTRITICNYDKYQDARITDETQMKLRRNADETQLTPNNNDNNANNENKGIKEKPDKPDFIDKIIDEYRKVFPEYKIVVPGRERKAAAAVAKAKKEEHPGENEEQALKTLHAFFENCRDIKDPWHKANMSLPHIQLKYNEINKRIKMFGPITDEDFDEDEMDFTKKPTQI